MYSAGKSIFFYLIAPVIVGAILWGVFQREYVDLQYSMSEPLPTKFLSDSGPKTVQQLTIINRGNVPARDVKVEAQASINRFDVQKNLATDEVVTDKDGAKFHAVYGSLAAGAKAKFVFELDSGEILSEDLLVSHSKGAATEVFSESSSKGSFYSVASIVFPLFYLVLMFFEFRSTAVSSIESQYRYKSPENFLSGKKPLIISEKKWKELRVGYVENYKFSKYSGASDIESSDIYCFLNSDKPDYFSDDEWLIFRKKIHAQFQDFLDLMHARYIGTSLLERLLECPRPEGFSKKDWDDFVEKVSGSFVSFHLESMLSFTSLASIEKKVIDEKPVGISESSWVKFETFSKFIFYVKACDECISDYLPITKYESLSKTLLTDEQREELYQLAYRSQFNSDPRLVFLSRFDAENFLDHEKPGWLKDEDLAKLKERAEFLKASADMKDEYEFLLGKIELVFSGGRLGDKPNVVSDKRWREFVEFYDLIEEKIDTVHSDQLQLSTLKAEVSEFRERLLRQLDIIDRVISDPSYVKKVEDFDNPFSEGNFENLRKISAILSTC